MRSPHVDDFVRLRSDIPELALSRGEIGVVRSTWFAPSVAYEVEFHQIGHDYQTRALILADQLEVEEGPLLDPAIAGPLSHAGDARLDSALGGHLR